MVRAAMIHKAQPTDKTVANRRKEAAKRAASEADQRRKKRADAPAPTEIGGRKGPDPARYGDWENKGIASDF